MGPEAGTEQCLNESMLEVKGLVCPMFGPARWVDFGAKPSKAYIYHMGIYGMGIYCWVCMGEYIF